MGGGGKGKAPPPPDYTPIAQASKEAAEVSAAVAREQLAWAKEQYKLDRAVTDRVLDTLLPQMEEQNRIAAADRQRYERVFQPVEDALVREAQAYASPGRIEQEAGRAVADVSQAFNAQREQALQRLEGFGIDPSQTRSAALDVGVRTAQAAAEAAAANQARINTENVGRALRGEAINIGRGYPGQVAQSYAGAVQAGQTGMQGAINTTLSGGQTMGNPVAWQGLSNQAIGNWGDLTSRMYASQIEGYRASQASRPNWAGLLGGALGFALSPAPAGGFGGTWLGSMLSRQTGGPIPYQASPSGGAIPDDVPVAATAGEYMIPRDVVMRKGTEFFENLIAKARRSGAVPVPQGAG